MCYMYSNWSMRLIVVALWVSLRLEVCRKCAVDAIKYTPCMFRSIVIFYCVCLE